MSKIIDSTSGQGRRCPWSGDDGACNHSEDLEKKEDDTPSFTEAEDSRVTSIAQINDKSPPTKILVTDRDEEKQVTAEPIDQTANRSSPLSKARTIALVVTLTGAAFLNTALLQACVIVLPQIGKDLHVPAAREQWIISAYSLAFGCFLLLWGRLADVYGKRLIFVYGSAWMCLVTLVCPFVPSEIGFDIFRGLQGLGAAANVPTAIGILGVTFAPGKAKNYAFAAYSAGAPLGSIFGNLLGGVIGQYLNWHWIFWILAIAAGLVAVAGYFVIPLPRLHPTEAQVKNAVDWPGGILITVGLVVLMFALTEGNVVGWSTPWIPVLIVVAILLIATFVGWQLYLEKKTTRRPLMKVTIFTNVRVSAAMAIMALAFGSFSNFLVFATFFYQNYQGHDPISTTARFIPTGVVGLLVVVVVSQILARIKVQYILMFGCLAATIGALLFAVPIPPTTTYWAYGLESMCLYVFGVDTIFPSSLLIVSHSLPREDQAIGGATINMVAQLGRAIGLAIATAIQVAVQSQDQGSGKEAIQGGDNLHNPAYLSGIRAAEWFNFAMVLLAFCIATVAFRGAGKVGVAKK